MPYVSSAGSLLSHVKVAIASRTRPPAVRNAPLLPGEWSFVGTKARGFRVVSNPSPFVIATVKRTDEGITVSLASTVVNPKERGWPGEWHCSSWTYYCHLSDWAVTYGVGQAIGELINEKHRNRL
jgi:hypothetical protein